MRHTGLDEAEIGIKISGRNIHNLRYTDDTTLTAESEEELRSLLMKLKEEGAKAGFKYNLQKTKIMGKTEDERRRGEYRISSDGITDSMA